MEVGCGIAINSFFHLRPAPDTRHPTRARIKDKFKDYFVKISVAAVVVTFNRKALLEKCLQAISGQSLPPDRIIIINNASTDGTQEMLVSNGWLARNNIELIHMPTNSGGAGGFAKGLEHAISTGADWAWMMDDDALPDSHALACLLNRELNKNNIYASTAVCGPKLSWPMVPEGENDSAIYFAEQVAEELVVDLVPFIGILVSNEVVRRIGLPDSGFFLVADDVEYSFRARKSGAKVVLVGSSRIEHPASERYSITLIHRRLDVLKLAPWKRYYEVRNRLLLQKYYFSPHLKFSNYVGWLLRLLLTLWHEPDRAKQFCAYAGGLIDGILERKGQRHMKWGL